MKYNPEIHDRRSIRLKEYDYSKEGMYYITICTQNRECILGNIKTTINVNNMQNVGAPAHRCPEHTTKIHLSKEGQIVEKYLNNIDIVYENIKLEEYVIMPNHVHFIINVTSSGHLWAGAPTRGKSITIAKIINSLKTLTSKEIGYPIWQRNYYEHVIRDEKELYKIIEYIQYNPYNWVSDENYKK